MSSFAQIHTSLRKSIVRIRSIESRLLPLVALPVLVPLAAHAQGSPFDDGFTAWQALVTRTVAKVAGLIAIVIGGYQFAVGTDIGVLAANRSDLPLACPADETNSERPYPYPIEQ
jgi:type IV secretory pathway VirB2 component (pilin)